LNALDSLFHDPTEECETSALTLGNEQPYSRGRCEADVDDAKRELFTTQCSHVFHRCCLVRCREVGLCRLNQVDP
jgi:hypothetical protein